MAPKIRDGKHTKSLTNQHMPPGDGKHTKDLTHQRPSAGDGRQTLDSTVQRTLAAATASPGKPLRPRTGAGAMLFEASQFLPPSGGSSGDLAGTADQHAMPSGGKSLLRWRSTFIEVGDDNDGSLSPRARSAPDLSSDVDRSSECSTMFSTHRAYVENLTEKLSHMWTSHARSITSEDSVLQESMPENLDMRRLRSGERASRQQHAQSSTRSAGSSCDVPTETEKLASAAVVARSSVPTPQKLYCQMSFRELREHMDDQTNLVSDHLQGQTRKRALEAIEELPEHVDEVLQASVTTLFEEVHDQVVVMQELVREQDAGAGDVAQAVESLEIIPGLILDNFQHNVAKVNDTIRERVACVIDGVKGGHFNSNDEIVAEMRSLPEEVQQLASEAMEAAQRQSKAETRMQFEEAMGKLPGDLGALSSQIVERLARVPLAAEKAARAAATVPVEQYVDAVDTQEELIKVVANQVVADFLLRAKSLEEKDDQPGQPSSSHDQPGQASAPKTWEPSAPKTWVTLADLKEHQDRAGGHAEGAATRPAGWAPENHAEGPLLNVNREPERQMVTPFDQQVGQFAQQRDQQMVTPFDQQQVGQFAQQRDQQVGQFAQLATPLDQQRDQQVVSGGDAQFDQQVALPTLTVMNAGSLGHPELCTRPCLYFPLGDCKNGVDCDFCHLNHSRRPAHLDKRHREMLRQLPFEECMALLLPVLRQKVESITSSPTATRMVESLATLDAPPPPGDRRPRRSSRQLGVAMEAMSLRMLLTSLHRSVVTDSPRRKQLLDDLLLFLRSESRNKQAQPKRDQLTNDLRGELQRHGKHRALRLAAPGPPSNHDRVESL